MSPIRAKLIHKEVIGMVKFFAMVIRLIKSLFLPQASRVVQVVPMPRQGTKTPQVQQDILMSLVNKYNGNLMSKVQDDGQGNKTLWTKTYHLRAIDCTVMAKEGGAISVIDEQGMDVTELVVAAAMV
jgi:hypothetical protein